MNMRQTTIAMAALAVAFSTVSAQQQYTLEQCVDKALASNISLRNADNSVRMAQEQRKEAFTKYFPTVSASGTGFLANEELVQIDLGGMGISMVKNGLMGSVTAMQPVFAGGQIVNGNRLAKVGEEASRLQRGLTENDVRLNVETYYYQVVMLKEKLVTLAQLEAQLGKLGDDAEAAVSAGVRNRNDLLQVQLRQNEVLTTRIQVQNALSLSRSLLAQAMGLGTDSADVSLTVGSEMPASPGQLYVSPEAAVTSTREYQLLDKQVEAERLNYRIETGKNMPTVAVGGGYLYNDLMDKSANKLVGMVSVSVPLSGWWGGSHAMKRQKMKWQNAENSRQNQSEMLVIRIRKAWNDVTDAYKQLDIARQSIDQSTENLRLNTNYYKAGTSAMSDLLDAQTLFQQARDKYVEAYTQYEVRKREYLQATGR